MPHKPTQAHKKPAESNNSPKSPKTTTQHGIHQNDSHLIPYLLFIPSESLTHITSFLEPPSLLSLQRVNKQLYDHINDDNTWHRAFLYRYLSIGPENNPETIMSIMLRRKESSWKKEFVMRYNLRLRWEKSRTSTVTHSPLISTVSSIHLVSENGLLTSSIQYGIVSRSHPQTGKIFRGYLDAGGTMNGLGAGNPNLEFSPNVSTSSIVSDGGTAQILWGFRGGEVAVTTATRVMDTSRTGGAKFVRCGVDDQHTGTVRDTVWGAGGNVFVSAGIDGRVKLWDGKTVRCLWTSTEDTPLVDPCTKLAFDVEHGTVAVALQSGRIVLYVGLAAFYTITAIPQHPSPEKINIHRQYTESKGNPDEEQSQELATLSIHHSSDTHVSILAHHVDNPHFYRYYVDLPSRSVVDAIRFGDEYNGAIRSIKSFIAHNAGEASFVVTGDQLGFLSVYNWDEKLPTDAAPIPPFRRIEAYEDGSHISSIEWNHVILVTGSSHGTVRAWDSLTFEPLRSFASPGSKTRGDEWEGVTQMVLEKEIMVVAVGDKVMTWKVGSARNANGKVIHHSGRKVRNHGSAKWQQQIELSREVAESKHDLETEQKHRRRRFGREKEHLGTLDTLGMNEREALEYVLMLSRDEEEKRLLDTGSRTVSVEDDLFQSDFDAMSLSPSHYSPSSSPRTAAVPSCSSNAKVQLSPRRDYKSLSAGFSENFAGVGHSNSAQSDRSIKGTDRDGFPTMSSSLSSTSNRSTGSSGKVSLTGSPSSFKSAWSAPLKSTPPSPTNTKTLRQRTRSPEEPDEDRDLRYAIELSLAEARSRGQNI